MFVKCHVFCQHSKLLPLNSSELECCSRLLLSVGWVRFLQRFLLARTSSCSPPVGSFAAISENRAFYFSIYLFCVVPSEMSPIPPFPFLPLISWFSFFLSFRWHFHLFDSFSLYWMKPGGIQFVVLEWMETLALGFFFIWLVYVGGSASLLTMCSQGLYCIGLDNCSLWSSHENQPVFVPQRRPSHFIMMSFVNCNFTGLGLILIASNANTLGFVGLGDHSLEMRHSCREDVGFCLWLEPVVLSQELC